MPPSVSAPHLHRKSYDDTKLRFESVLGGLSAPFMTRAFSYSPPRPLMSAVERAEREARVARSLRPVAERFGIGVIQPDTDAPAEALWTAPVDGPNLVELLNAGEAGPELGDALHHLGRLHAYLAQRWHSLGDVSWANVIVSRAGEAPLLTLCDFEHAAWPQHAGLDDPACLTPPAGASQPHWAPDDLYEGLVTTACKLHDAGRAQPLVRAYAEGLAAESRVVAYAVARLFPLRRTASRMRVGTSRWIDARGQQQVRQLEHNYDVLAEAVADAVALPGPLRQVQPRPRAWLHRTLGWLKGDEYGWDASAYHDYARTFEDRDGAAARCLLALPALHGRDDLDVLDVGAGTGLIGGTAALCHPGWRMTLLDPSAEQLAQARAQYGDRLRYVRAGMEQPGLPDAAFDLILMASAIRYCPEPVRAVQEMARMLRPGGQVVVLPTDFSGANDVLYAELGLRSAESIEAFFEQHGFRSLGPQWTLHVRRGFAGRPLVFTRS